MKRLYKLLVFPGLFAATLLVAQRAAQSAAKQEAPSLAQLKGTDIPCLAPVSPGEKAWGKKVFFWKKREITFSFLPNEGTAKLKDRVTAEALKWNGIASVSLKRVPDGQKSDVRVGFGASGHWSKVGNTAARVAAGDRTMNLQVTDSTGTGEVRRVTLHEFGHALGLMHEHQSPSVAIQWKEDAVLKYYSGSPNYWNEAQIRENLLSHYDKVGVLDVGFDPKSIMLYPISSSLTYNFSSGNNTTLSDKDKEWLKQAYP